MTFISYYETFNFILGPGYGPTPGYNNHLQNQSKLHSVSAQDLRNGNIRRGGAEDDQLMPEFISEDDILRFNVCGMVYETLKCTVERFPLTLLGDKTKRERFFVKSRNAYFFDRNRQTFEAILYYYQSGGILIRPPTIPMILFAEEIAFFDLGDDALVKLQEDEGYILDKKCEKPSAKWQRVLWDLFEFPDTSLAARILAIWSVFVIVLSITVFCLETIPQVTENDGKNMTNKVNLSEEKYTQPWFSLEIACIIWFTLEYLIRLISSPNKWNFLRSFLNMIDLLAILPYFITLSIKSGNTTPLSVLRVVRLVRVFRIFKLSRHSLGLRILGLTLKASVSELGMLIFFLILGVILFSSAIFYAEQEHNGQFESIPDAFWYTLVTMTTVGYGDKVPKTLPGKFVGSLCAIVGVLTIALPVPVIVSNFEFFYKRDRLDYEHRKELISREPTPEIKRGLIDATKF